MDLKRDTPAALLSSLSGSHFYPIVLMYLDWPGAPMRCHSNAGVISWSGHEWAGVGRFGALSIPGEGLSGVPEEFSISLLTDYPDIEEYTDTVIRGIAGSVYLGATSSRGGIDLIGAVEIVSGTADVLSLGVQFEGENSLLELSVAMTTGPSMRTMASINHSDADQRRQYPDDTAGELLIELVSSMKKDLWPAP